MFRKELSYKALYGFAASAMLLLVLKIFKTKDNVQQ
jgi:hypothetical protein